MVMSVRYKGYILADDRCVWRQACCSGCARTASLDGKPLDALEVELFLDALDCLEVLRPLSIVENVGVHE